METLRRFGNFKSYNNVLYFLYNSIYKIHRDYSNDILNVYTESSVIKNMIENTNTDEYGAEIKNFNYMYSYHQILFQFNNVDRYKSYKPDIIKIIEEYDDIYTGTSYDTRTYINIVVNTEYIIEKDIDKLTKIFYSFYNNISEYKNRQNFSECKNIVNFFLICKTNKENGENRTNKYKENKPENSNKYRYCVVCKKIGDNDVDFILKHLKETTEELTV